jgi:oxaloacetate decarboxylase (Na+ extruding) subunit alpha
MDYWINTAKTLENMGADSICIKDMAGLLLPYKAAELITALKENVNVPVQLHTHCTSGVAPMTYLKAVESGCDIIDTAISPFSMGTSQPATEVMVETFKGTPFDTALDQSKLAEIADYFRPIQEKYLKEGLINPKVLGVNIKTLLYQVPGGMLSNLVSQLKEQKAEDKYYQVLEEIPRVRDDLGQPPLVTPSSQIVGTQAVFNVLSGERYKMMTKETKAVLAGEYGKTVKEFNKEIQEKALEGKKPIHCRPADLLEPELEKMRQEQDVVMYQQQEEDVLSYALFPQVAVEFFKFREAQKTKIDPKMVNDENKAYPV